MPYDTDPLNMNPNSVQIAAPRNQFSKDASLKGVFPVGYPKPTVNEPEDGADVPS